MFSVWGEVVRVSDNKHIQAIQVFVKKMNPNRLIMSWILTGST